MNDLEYGLRQLCMHNRDGSFKTQGDRWTMLRLMSGQLVEGGFRGMTPHSIKAKHVSYLLQRWQQEDLKVGTLKNRMSTIRWWLQKVNKAHLIPKGNATLGIPNRRYVSDISEAKELDEQKLQAIKDESVRMSLRLQAAFGLRREESIKFQPAWADRGNYIHLKPSWCKGGRGRRIPLLTQEQREVLDAAHRLVGKGSLIPPDKRYIQQENRYDASCNAVGLNNMHGLRHHYAQKRYQTLMGIPCPHAGGPHRKR